MLPSRSIIQSPETGFFNVVQKHNLSPSSEERESAAKSHRRREKISKMKKDSMPPGGLPGEVFRAHPTCRRPPGRPRTRWRDCVSRLAWERLGIAPEELDEVAGEREI